MGKNILLTLFFAVCAQFVLAQCTNVPVKEAVRNGDFDAGYIPGDFTSDMTYAGPDIATKLAANQCHYQTGSKIYVSDAEEIYSCEGATKQGTKFSPDLNTVGIDGSSDKILYVDPTPGTPIIWRQTVNTAQNQVYTFSFWYNEILGPETFFKATANNQAIPLTKSNEVTFPVQLTKIKIVNGGPVIDGNGNYERETSVVNVKWTQYSGTWISNANTTADLKIQGFANAAFTSPVQLFGQDFALDKISFINSCQNVYNQNVYTVDFNQPDTVNLCEIGGSVTLDPGVPVNQRNNATILWFSGTGSSQTQIDNGVFTKQITAPGTYRVCVDDPDNSCGLNDVITVIEKFNLSIPDIELCSPAQVSLDAGVNIPNGAMSSISWTGPSGTSSTRNYTVNKAGSHSVTVVGAFGHACGATDNFNVTSKLPTVPTNLEYCDGGGTATNLIVGDGKSYTWSTSQTMTPVIGTGISVPWTPANGTTGDQTLWIQNATTTTAGTMSGPTLSGAQGNAVYTTNITTYQAVNIKTVRMGIESWTGGGTCGGSNTGTVNVTVDLLNSSNAVVSSKVVAAPCGSLGAVNLNMSVPAGNYKLRATSTGNLYTTAVWSGTASTYSLPGYIDVTGYSAHYGALGQMVIEKSEACDPIPVIIKAKSCCTAPNVIPKIDYAASTLNVCDPNKATIVAKALSNGLDYKWQVSHNNGGLWKDTLATGVVSGTTNTLSNVSKSAWYRIVVANTGNLAKSCVKNSDSAIVVIKPLPTAITVTVNPNQTSFCKGIPHTLTASATPPGSTYQWKYAGTGTNATINGLTTVGTHNYKVVATLNGCIDSSAMKTITINALPDSSITSVGPFCGDASAAVNLTGATAGGTWKIDNVALGGSSFIPKNYTTGMHVVEYDVTSNGCSSDDTMQFHIIKKDTATITAAGPFCKNAAAVTLKAVNTGGTWSGTGITSGSLGTFTPNSATIGANIITYTIAGACGDSKTTSITVNATDSAKINTVGAMCSSSPAITLNTYLTGGSTTGGTWSGTGITDALTGAFDPSVLAQNTYKIKYVTGGACPTADSVNISITNGVNLSFLGTQKTTYCQNSAMDTMKVSQLLSGGLFRTSSGKGITDATNGYYNPSLADLGTDTVFYEKSQVCGDTIYALITVNAVDSVGVNSEGVFCLSDVAKQLTVTAGTAAGTWSASCGACITSGGMFNPTTAGVSATLTPAYHVITYTSNGVCKKVDTIHVTVVDQKISDITTPATTKCKNAAVFQIALSGNSTPNGVWSSSPAGKVDNAGNFTPSTAGVGLFTVYYKLPGATSTCSAEDSVKITVSAIDTAKIVSAGPFCASESAQQLAVEAVSAAGTWSSSCGACITSGGMFNPVTATAGKYQVSYTTSGSCPVVVSDSVTVVGQKISDITTLATTKCKNAAGFQIALSGNSTPQGVWSSNPVGKVSNTGIFDPSTSGVGLFTVYYKLLGQTPSCSAEDSVKITVTAIDTAKISTTPVQGPYCVNDPVQTLLKETVSSAGNWSAGCGACITSGGAFTPLTAGVGNHQVTYTTTGACPVSDVATIVVVSQMVADITTVNNKDICVDAGLFQIDKSAGSTANGQWGSIPSGLVNSTTGQFNSQLAGVSTGVKVYYSVSGATTTCSASDTILLNVLPREEAAITNAPSPLCTYDSPYTLIPQNAGGTWSSTTGLTAGGVFNPAASGAGTFEVRYKINGTCFDEDTIQITVIAPKDSSINAAGPFCENLGLQELSGVVYGGTFSGTGITNGTLGNFSPSLAGAGVHTITYSHGGVCPSDETIDIVVEDLPTVVPLPDVTGGCVPLTVNMADSSSSASQLATWTFGDGGYKTLQTSNASTSHTYNKVGTFDIWLKIQFLNGCKDSAQTKVTVTEVPVADFSFGPQPASTLDPTILFTNQSTGATNYLWDFGGRGTPDSSVNVDEIVKFKTDTAEAKGFEYIRVSLVASNAVCSDTVRKDVLLKDNFTMYTPNAFSPNGDGLNDLFYPMGANHKCETCTNYEFMVFNRWGELVFRTTVPYDPWNGKRNNNMRDAEIDVYVWRVIYTDSFTGKEGKQMGTVTLVR